MNWDLPVEAILMLLLLNITRMDIICRIKRQVKDQQGSQQTLK